MAPMLRMSAYFSSSAVRAVPGSPVKGPSPGSAPAVSDGSGICPGIIAGDTAPRAAERETRPVTARSQRGTKPADSTGPGKAAALPQGWQRQGLSRSWVAETKIHKSCWDPLACRSGRRRDLSGTAPEKQELGTGTDRINSDVVPRAVGLGTPFSGVPKIKVCSY